MYLKASSNNKASTALATFNEEVESYYWLSRIRIDKGKENAEIEQGLNENGAQLMRRRRDLCDQALDYFRKLFFMMEAQGVINTGINVNLFCLHYIFIPGINNEALKEFIHVLYIARIIINFRQTIVNPLTSSVLLACFGAMEVNREIKKVCYREEIDGAELNEDGDIEVSSNATEDKEDFSFEVPKECKQYLNQSVDQLMESTEQKTDTSLHAKDAVLQHFNRN